MPQSLSNVLVHLVFSTKDRRPNLPEHVRSELHAYLVGILRNNNCHPLQVGGFDDHVHLLLNLSRTLTIAQLVEHLKTGSSKWLKTKGPDFAGFAWQGGYGAFSVGPTEVERIVRYVQRQEEHHRKVTFQEEFRKLCQEHGVTLDERYVWD
ncbi:MAG: IS200/IS605 family transposase [Armatimonadetes bacterium]|nr:IS200/IS605 family transposase [Armatimonadota bacterium]NOG92994.1 IS200/IS605 family transposase [Armatimonadota bacterium]